MRFHPGSRGQFKLPRLGYNREIRMWSLDHEIKIQSFDHVIMIIWKTFPIVQYRFQDPILRSRSRSDPDCDPILRTRSRSNPETLIAILFWDPDRGPILIVIYSWDPNLNLILRSWWWSNPQLAIQSWDPDVEPILRSLWWSNPEILMVIQNWKIEGLHTLNWRIASSKLEDRII